jgi:hypothetical protein
MSGGPDIQGKFEGATATGLAVRPFGWIGTGSVPIAPVTGVQALYERGNAHKEGSILGGLAGIGIALAFGMDDKCLLTSPDNHSSCVMELLGHGALGAFVGGGVGWAVGRRVPRWHRRFPQ